jgi:hypothetical protein
MTEWWRTQTQGKERRPEHSPVQLSEQDEHELIKLVAISDPVLDWPLEDRCKRLRKNVMTAIELEPTPSAGFRLDKFL